MNADQPGPLAALARDIAARAHAGQVDKQGRDYLTHHLTPVALLLRPYGDHAEAVGWLHDAVEDTEETIGSLAAAGIPPTVLDAVHAVTRQDGETYTLLIRRAAAHPLGRVVKLADNWVNLTGLDALAVTDPVTAARLRVRYELARRRLAGTLAGAAW